MFKFVSELMGQCLPSNLLTKPVETDAFTQTQHQENITFDSNDSDNYSYFHNQDLENIATEWTATSEYTELDWDYNQYEEARPEDELPLIRLFGHGWDPSFNDSELETPSYKKVSQSELDVAWIYAIQNRVPYIECIDDDVSHNVELLDWEKTPNMLINISGFKSDPVSSKFKFGLYELTYDCDWNVIEKCLTGKWLETNTSNFTLKDMVRYLNQKYPNGYILELHMGREPLVLFKDDVFPDYVQKSRLATETLFEYALEHPDFDPYNAKTPVLQEQATEQLFYDSDDWESVSENSADDEVLVYHDHNEYNDYEIIKELEESLNEESKC
jgi:hypothetical protein